MIGLEPVETRGVTSLKLSPRYFSSVLRAVETGCTIQFRVKTRSRGESEGTKGRLIHASEMRTCAAGRIPDLGKMVINDRVLIMWIVDIDMKSNVAS